MYSSAHDVVRLSRDLKRLFRGVSRTTATAASADVSRPARIRREPTDLLKALAAGVKEDPLGPHYRFHDDPFLIPLSNMKKRAYALSAEAGRRAATWIRSEHEKQFSIRSLDPPTRPTVPYHNSDPPIEAYLPPFVWNDKSEVSEEVIKKLIALCRVEEVSKAYRIFKNPLSTQTKMDLLQLLAFHNETEPFSDRWQEERWFRQGKWNSIDRVSNTWKQNSLAEEIFNSLEEKTSEAYCALIQGMCKYHQAERAFELTDEALGKNIKLSTNVFNALLNVTGFVKSGNEQRRALIKDILVDMNEQKLTPNIGTLNAALEGIVGPSVFSGTVTPQDKEMASRLLVEMESLGIRPSAATWYHFLNLYCRERGPRSDVLFWIVSRLENDDATGEPDSLMPPRDPKDTLFFYTAMQVCNEHLRDINLAVRLDNLLQVNDRKGLLSDSYKESVYRRNQMLLFAKLQPLDQFMIFYDKLVPHRYIPEPSVMEEVLKAIGIGLTDFADKPVVGPARLEKIWTQMVAGSLTRRQKLLELMVQVTQLCVHLEDLTVEKERLSNICTSIWKSIEDQPTDRPALMNWTGDMLGQMLDVFHACGAYDSAKLVMNRLHGRDDVQRGVVNVFGVPVDPRPILNMPQWALDNKDPKTAAAAVAYLYEMGFPEASDAAKIALDTMLAPADLVHFASVDEKKLDLLDDHLKQLLLIYRSAGNNAAGSSESSASSESSSDEETEPAKAKGDHRDEPSPKDV